MTQADVSLAVFWDFATRLRPNFFANLNCDAIDILTDSLRIQTHLNTQPVEAALNAALPETKECGQMTSIQTSKTSFG